ncbi:MAG: hypothetical protein AB8G99_03165 [Planctomycetaceae bacterium]
MSWSLTVWYLIEFFGSFRSGKAMRKQTTRLLTTGLLLAVGYVAGLVQWPERTYAQQAPAKSSSENFVVVAGAMSATSRVGYYYVVTADGTAKKVLLDGSPVYTRAAAFPSKVEVKHDLPSRIRLDHSGRISD